MDGMKGKSSLCGVWGKANKVSQSPHQIFGFALSTYYDSLKISPLTEDNCEKYREQENECFYPNPRKGGISYIFSHVKKYT
ncbi:hypothetical protein DN406_27585 [Bacillus sp. BB56-3]|nr:hypothetical protein DN406_27585 [Bacillus sp. BB56-3]